MSEGIDFETVWERILDGERAFFRTHQGVLFTYRVHDGFVHPSHSDQAIPKHDFETVFPLLPVRPPQKIAKHVAAYPYVWAILHDGRISRGDW